MEKQINEMAQDIAQVIDDVHAGCRLTDCEDCRYFDNTLEMCKSYAIAERLYALDYQKQVQGEWIYYEAVITDEGFISGYSCSLCNAFVYEEDFHQDTFYKKFCGNCGAKMKGN